MRVCIATGGRFQVQVSDPQVDDEESVTTLETPMPEPSVESKAGSFLEGLKLTK